MDEKNDADLLWEALIGSKIPHEINNIAREYWQQLVIRYKAICLSPVPPQLDTLVSNINALHKLEEVIIERRRY